MPKIELKIRRMKTGETLIAEFQSIEDCKTWLADRPAFEDVLGCVTDLPAPEIENLKKLMRPLDDQERAFEAHAKERRDAEMQRLIDEERKRDQAEAEAYREQLKNADPKRPLPIQWIRGDGMRIADPYDDRQITEAAREAVLAWVRERDTWVEKKGHVVDTATVQVYPAELPEGKELRVVPGGQFTTSPANSDPTLN